MPIAAYRAIVEQIMRTVNRAGYWSKKQLEGNERIKSRRHHGFDMGKLTPSSLFCLPCQAENPVDSFFIDHHSPGRVPLDPYVWSGYAANHHQPAQDGAETVAATLAQPVHQAMPTTDCPKLRRMRELIADEEVARHRDNLSRRKAAAIERWHGTPAQGGNRAFFQLGVDLGSAGMTMADIDPILRQEAGYGRHPSERRAQIKYIMRTLRTSSRRLAA